MPTRRALRLGAALLLFLGAALGGACSTGSGGQAPSRRRVIVLGFDGMDYGLTKEMMSQGRLPHLTRLASMGTFRRLATSMPPQSPVAWSNFVTGLDSGGHGIFDFIHRDPETLANHLSTTRTGPARGIPLWKWQFPLIAPRIELLRHGTAFWEVLERRGIKTSIIRMPANFPPSRTASRELSGMGTPDVIGASGIFSYYTSSPGPWAGKPVDGGAVYEVHVVDGAVKGTLWGPRNPLRVESEMVSRDFSVYVDPNRPLAKLAVGDEERVLAVGEWSDWVPLRFDLMPTQSIQAIARFYLKQIRPEFNLYVTPINFDPQRPVLPLSEPPSFSAALAEATGRFYTQGMPEDVNALRMNVFTREEFLVQAGLVREEVARQYEYMLDRFDGGLLFYYFGSADQVSHVMWGAMDPAHPAYRESDARFADTVKKVYEYLDGIVGRTLDAMGDDAILVVMSDHGFTSWRRSFSLAAWLRDNGYLETSGSQNDVSWSRTRAYARGLNGLYINLAGRERWGIVRPSEREALMTEIAGKLLEIVDPKTGERAVTRVMRREEYRDRGHLGIGPDLIVGYARGFRVSNESATGEIPEDVFVDNLDAWNGDHCMDPDVVPGVLFSSRPLKRQAEKLEDVAPAILTEFGIDGFPVRHGPEGGP